MSITPFYAITLFNILVWVLETVYLLKYLQDVAKNLIQYKFLAFALQPPGYLMITFAVSCNNWFYLRFNPNNFVLTKHLVMWICLLAWSAGDFHAVENVHLKHLKKGRLSKGAKDTSSEILSNWGGSKSLPRALVQSLSVAFNNLAVLDLDQVSVRGDSDLHLKSNNINKF